MALVGWASGDLRLASLGSGLIPMAPSTAVLFLLTGTALCARAVRPRHQPTQRAVTFAAALAASASGLLLALSLAGVHLAVVHLGFQAASTVQGAPVGHMSPVTATCFLLASLSTLAARGSHRAKIGALLSSASAALLLATSAVFTLAYAYGEPLLYGGRFIPPALTTVLAFTALATGALIVPHGGLIGDVDQARRRTVDALLVSFALVAAGIITAGRSYYKVQEHRQTSAAEARLCEVADLQAGEVAAWRNRIRADAAMFAGNSSFSGLVRRNLDDPTNLAVAADLHDWLGRLRASGEYLQVALVDPTGGMLMAEPDSAVPLGKRIAAQVPAALQSSEVTFVDLGRDVSGGPVSLGVLAPLFDRGGAPLGVLALQVDPSTWLYPFLAHWPGASHTAEADLVRREGDEAVFLNPAKWAPRAPFVLGQRLADGKSPVARAILGAEGPVHGVGYRGVPVLACARSVPFSPWKLVTRRDLQDVLEPLSARLWETVLTVVTLLVGGAAALGLLFRQQVLTAERRYHRALDAMMEGAQIIGADERCAYANEAAASFVRRSARELIGRTLTEIYDGIQAAPMLQALQRSTRDRSPLRGEFDLSFLDGETRWIELTATPVPEGLFVLTLDITNRKRSEEALRQNEARILQLNAMLHAIRNVNRLITHKHDAEELIQQACGLLVESRGVDTCCIALLDGDRGTHFAGAGAGDKLHALRRIFDRGQLPQCLRAALAQDDPVVRHDPATPCIDCDVSKACSGLRDTVTLRLASDGKVFGAMLVSASPGVASDPEELDLLREIAGDTAFALESIARAEQRNRALAEIESLARFPSENPNPVLRLARDGRILLANPSSAELLAHWQRAVGQVAPDDICLPAHEALDSGDRRDIVVQVASGRQFVLAFTPISSAGYVNLYGVEITDRLRAELDVQRLNARLVRLAQVARELAGARSLEAIIEIVRHAARDLANADGATFVLREGDLCHYVDEDAIAPLWKGQRFPMSACVSGWAMLHREAAVIEDVLLDPRVPHDAYRETFVRGMVMVPIGSELPTGAIGAYWRSVYRATPEEVRILQSLADSVSIAMDNVRVYAALAESEARTRAIYQNLPTSTFVWRRVDAGFVLEDYNEAALKTTRGGIAQFVGRTAVELPHAFPHLLEDLERCFTEHALVHREVEYCPPGSSAPRTLKSAFSFVPPSVVVLHTEDVTDQRRLEEQLRASQRLESIGRLAGGVAHDFNNLLSVILSYTSIALESAELVPSLRSDMTAVRQAGERAATLTRQLLAFSRKQVLQPKVLCPADVVEGIEGILRRLLGEDIDLLVTRQYAVGNAKVDPGQLEQVIMNLAVNARDAMPEGGKLTIETRNVELDDAFAAKHTAMQPGPHVLLSMSDTGCGMDENTLARMFEPFFTTKESGKGTGLGLATVYGIVKQSGGSIWAYSELGKGTSFKIYFPRIDAPSIAAPSLAPKRARTKGTETILLVEDDAGVHSVVTRMLKRAGFTVLGAESPSDALRLCEDRSTSVDLVLTDVIMPEMSGRALATQLQAMRPGLPVLFMSGYTDNAIVHHGVLDEGSAFIGKPFTEVELTSKVREVLDEVRARREGKPST